MNGVIWRCAKADALERARRPAYTISLMVFVVLTFLMFPAIDAPYQVIDLNGYRGIYNSAWMGASLAMLQILFLPIFCFYLIKNALAHDREQRVGDLIASSPISTGSLMLAKWLSNMALLTGICLLMVVTSIMAQLWFGDDRLVNVAQYILPQLMFVWPVMALLAALALLFESVRWLRGGWGNVLYFYLWCGALVGMMKTTLGFSAISEQMKVMVQTLYPSADMVWRIGISVLDADRVLKTFVWPGLEYRSAMLLMAMIMLSIAAVTLLLAIVIFDRFRHDNHPDARSRAPSFLARLWAKMIAPLASLFGWLCEPFAFSRMIRLEFVLLCGGRHPVWYLLLTAGVVAQLMLSIDAVLHIVLPAVFLLCTLTLSPLGQREAQSGTSALLFSCVSPMRRQFPAMCCAGLLLLLLCCSGALLRFALAGDMLAFTMLVNGCLFVVLLALALGSMTGSTRAFEIIFTGFWYMGLLQGALHTDFIGVHMSSAEQLSMLPAYGLANLVLLTLAWFSRWRQVAR